MLLTRFYSTSLKLAFAIAPSYEQDEPTAIYI